MGLEVFDGIIDKDNLSEMLKAFHYTIGLTTYLMSAEGQILLQYGPTYPYCTYVYSRIPESLCHEVRVNAGKKAMEFGSAYIFTCHANLSHIAFPIINAGVILGSIQVGPFLLSPPDSALVMEIRDRFSEFSMEDLMNLYDDAADIPLMSPEQVTQLSKLIYYLMSNVITDSKERFLINQKKLAQQSKISDSIQMYKNVDREESFLYPVEKEKELMSCILAGNLTAAKAVLNDLLGLLYLEYGNNISLMRVRMIELGSVMIHTALENVTDSAELFLLSNHFIHDMPGISNQDELSFRLNELLENIMDFKLPLEKDHNRAIVNALDYVNKHFQESIDLPDVAEAVSLNPSYFSRLFKHVTGRTFKEHLTFVRIEEAKRLLRYTDYQLIDIAIAVGFESQSYFSQVFKKATGISPNKFRNQ